jgi:hypothetical protein
MTLHFLPAHHTNSIEERNARSSGLHLSWHNILVIVNGGHLMVIHPRSFTIYVMNIPVWCLSVHENKCYIHAPYVQQLGTSHLQKYIWLICRQFHITMPQNVSFRYGCASILNIFFEHGDPAGRLCIHINKKINFNSIINQKHLYHYSTHTCTHTMNKILTMSTVQVNLHLARAINPIGILWYVCPPQR